MPQRCGIADHPVANTPIAVFDFETTGLNPSYDCVVEVSVIRLDPGRPPRVVLDTLINPRRRVSATEIHGFTDADVADAPEFDEIIGDLLTAISGCVLTVSSGDHAHPKGVPQQIRTSAPAYPARQARPRTPQRCPTTNPNVRTRIPPVGNHRPRIPHRGYTPFKSEIEE